MYGIRELYILTRGTPRLRTYWMDLFLDRSYSTRVLANELTLLATIQITTPLTCFRRVQALSLLNEPYCNIIKLLFRLLHCQLSRSKDVSVDQDR